MGCWSCLSLDGGEEGERGGIRQNYLLVLEGAGREEPRQPDRARLVLKNSASSDELMVHRVAGGGTARGDADLIIDGA
jgi:hypothetical protein